MTNTLETIVKKFLEYVILAQAKKHSVNGYALIRYVSITFSFVLSSGTIYNKLYKLERNQLLTAKWDARKRSYTITTQGLAKLKKFMEDSRPEAVMIRKILKLPKTGED